MTLPVTITSSILEKSRNNQAEPLTLQTPEIGWAFVGRFPSVVYKAQV